MLGFQRAINPPYALDLAPIDLNSDWLMNVYENWV